MNINDFMKFMAIAERLKSTLRHSWTSTDRQESVAEHSWRLCLMAYLLKDELKEYNMDKVMLMCLVHDLGEAITGDIPVFYKKETDEVKEQEEVEKLLNILEGTVKIELKNIFDEIEEENTKEARIFKALDKLEVVIQHNEGPLDRWIDLEYELNLTYGEEEAKEFDVLNKIRKIAKEISKEKILNK